MRRSVLALAVALAVAVALAAAPAVSHAQQAAPSAPAASGKQALSLDHLLSWKSIRTPQASNDGKWFAYVLAPNEGDADVVLRPSAAGGKELKFAIGGPPAGGGGGPFGAAAASPVSLSGNGRWAAFTVYPKTADAKRARRDRRTLTNKLSVVELATGTRRDFDRVRAFRFAGDKSDWLAVHHAAPDAPAAGAGGASAAAAAPPSGGTVLELVNLADGTPVTMAGVAEFAIDESGRWIAYTIDSRDLIGNAVQLRELVTGITRSLDAQKASYRRLAWVDSGDALSALRSTVDSATNDTSFAVIGWSRLASATPTKVEVTSKSAGIDGGLVVSGDRAPRWGETQGVLYFGLREPRPPRPRETGSFTPPAPGGVAPGAGNTGQVAAAPQTDEDTPSLILWHWKDPRLQAQQQVQEAQDKNFSYLAAYNVPTSKVVRLADAKMRDVATSNRDRWAVGTDISPYERQASVDGKSFRDVYAIDITTGTRKPLATRLRGGGGFGGGGSFSPDGERLAYYDDGDYKAYEFATGTTRTLTTGVAATFWDDEDDHNTVKPAAAPPVGWSRDGGAFLVRDNWDIWKLPLKGAAQNLTANGKKDRIRYQARVGVPFRERGIDLARPMFVETYGEWTKKEGLARVDATKGGATTIAWEDAKVDFRKARDADAWFFTRQSVEKFPDWYAADAGLADERRLTDANPQQKDVAWSSGARLITYACDKGDTVQAALYLPANYEPGKKYPTLTYIYEKLSQGLNVYPQPNATRYANPAVYTSRGYAFLQPDITYKLDDPGRSAVACVVPAVKAAIATGIVDPAHVGLQGHSWGGYQTSFITTQTDIFKTAIAGAPLTDMVSMFSSVYWNSGMANQPIFISSQGRFSESYARNPDPYIRNSPNRFATNLNIPFMILHNDRDGAVDFNQGITYYNTLRELGKDVVLLEYVGENHGLARPANQKDYAVRMQEWFDTFLRDQPAPDWLKDGVPRLQMEQHLKDRKPLVDPTAKQAEEKKVTP